MRSVDIEQFLELVRSGLTAFDVRTPGEYASGHLPRAHNLPLFSDEERALVGTVYKQDGRHRAILEGLDFVGPRMRGLVESVERLAGPPGSPVLVHCWRGGMRSASVAWLLELYGYEVSILEGGYKAFRRWVLARLESSLPLRVLGGHTGSGKTEILEVLSSLGEPVIDLEALANHRGSAFGGVLLSEQPTQQDFENRLALEMARVDAMGGRVWIEDESHLIGHRHLPDALLKAKRAARVLVLDVPLEDRVRRLLTVYGEATPAVLSNGFDRVAKRLGSQRARDAKLAIERGNLAEAASIALQYYDRAYDHGLSLRVPDRVHPVATQGDLLNMARTLIMASETFDIREPEE